MKTDEVLTQQEVEQYKSMGYSEAEIQKALNDVTKEQTPLQQSYEQAQALKMKDPRALASQSFVTRGVNDNLIQWQLELDSILERIEHMLRGDKPKYESGSLIWKSAEENKDKIFNEQGVSEIMRILTNYVNRNTVLSNYKEETIDDKMFDLGKEISHLIYLKYEDFGLDTLQKRKLYSLIVREVVDITHSAYLRALHGGERESLREARQVSQIDNTAGGVTINTNQQSRTRGLLNPMRYIKGKYV